MVVHSLQIKNENRHLPRILGVLGVLQVLILAGTCWILACEKWRLWLCVYSERKSMRTLGLFDWNCRSATLRMHRLTTDCRHRGWQFYRMYDFGSI